MTDLFETNFQRPEDDEFVRKIMARLGGEITGIGPLQSGPNFWVETVRSKSARKPFALVRGRFDLKRCDFTVTVHNRTKAKNGIAIHPWRYEYPDGSPAGMGLFESEEAGKAWRKSR
jgi:hypothetical protein